MPNTTTNRNDTLVKLKVLFFFLYFSPSNCFFSPLTTCKLTETASNLSGWHSYWPLWLESTLAKIAKDSNVNNFFLFLLEKSLELSESGTICQSSDNGVPSRYLKKSQAVWFWVNSCAPLEILNTVNISSLKSGHLSYSNNWEIFLHFLKILVILHSCGEC